MSIFKRKSFYIIIVIILLAVSGYVYTRYKKANKPIEYETVKVLKGDLTSTVDATGKIQSTSDLSLRFETAGTLETIKIKEGDKVKSGDLLANLNLAELNAAVAQAQANLNKQLAGSTSEELSSLRAAMENAKAALDKASADASSTINTAESAVETAKNNLKLAEGGDSSKIVSNEYQTAVALLQKISSILDDALIQSDNILGVDNTIVNDGFEEYLSTQDTAKLNAAKNYFPYAKEAKKKANDLILPLTTLSVQADVDKALNETETALSKMNQLLVYTADVLNYTPPVGALSAAALDTKKTTITTSRSSVTTQYSSVIAQKQAIATAKNSYNNYLIAYNKALNDLATAKNQTAASIKVYEAAYNQATANYKNKLNPPREVDVAYYRAALAQVIANRDKAVLKAPMDGTITKVNKKKGEYVSIADTMLEMVAPHYEIQVDIPETDVSKINLNNDVDFTLDAFGDDLKFKGKIITIDPQSTEIQDVVYYKVKISIDASSTIKYTKDKQIKPGMTANATINTDKTGVLKGVLYVPLRTVLNKNGNKYVRVLLENNQLKEITVVLGLKADNGMVVISSGLKEGDVVVVSEKK